MKADFYLLNRSFRYQEGITLNDLEEALKHLATDYDFIRSHKESDSIKKHDSIYDEFLYENHSVSDILYSGKLKGQINRDTLVALRTIIDKADSDALEPDEVIAYLLQEHNQEQVYGLICLHKIDDVSEEYLVYSKHNWLEFHRYFLELYPKDENFFIEECMKYFPNLCIHERNKHEISSIFENFCKSIIKHLGYLNDVFYSYRYRQFDNESVKYQIFTSECNLEYTV